MPKYLTSEESINNILAEKIANEIERLKEEREKITDTNKLEFHNRLINKWRTQLDELINNGAVFDQD